MNTDWYVNLDTGAESWAIELPWDSPPIKPNGGYANRYAHARKVKDVRKTAGLLARQARIPLGLDRVRVQLVWYVPDRRRRDVDNLWMTLKALADGLTADGGKGGEYDWPVVEDDTPDQMEKPAPRIVYAKGTRKRLVLFVDRLDIG